MQNGILRNGDLVELGSAQFRFWLARTQQDYAQMLLARGGEADRARAAELLESAAATYAELGMA